jgi:iron complex outermembrane receptor protein
MTRPFGLPRFKHLSLSLVAITSLATSAAAQGRGSLPDSAGRTTTRLEPVVVTAERTNTLVSVATAAVTRLSAERLRQLPVRTVADALGYVPGIVVLQGDGLGTAPRVVVRGFYGGGETEYLTVLVDGVPTTEMASGLVNWDLIPLQMVESIEVLRGGASSLYGDAALGGVVNLITRQNRSYAQWRLSGGEFGQSQASGALGGKLGDRQASISGNLGRSSGYRDHERRDAGTLGGSLSLAQSPTHTLTLTMLNHWRGFEEPGPITDSLLAASPRAIAPFYRFDKTDERTHRVALDGATLAGDRQRVKGYLAAEFGSTDAVRTLAVAPQFSDTKARLTRSTRAVGSLQTERSDVLLGWASRLVVGTDFSAGRLTSEYRALLSGNASKYATAAPTPGAVVVSGNGYRTAAASFASWEIAPIEPLRLSLGGRYDWMSDRFDPQSPSKGQSTRTTHRAFSPRVGANLRYLNSARQNGSLYVTAGRSFKAPTMDQLFDQRPVPLPFPPYSITTSNNALEAQYGNSVEAGMYHRVDLVPQFLDARLSASAYQTDMRNELDFDLKSFRYVNIGRSRHRGVEAGLTLAGPAGSSAFVNYARQDATSRYGDSEGRFLKAIPRNALVTGAARTSAAGLSAALTATTVGETFLDDANTRTLQGHTQIDARASYPIRDVRLSLDVRNVFDRRYSSTGYPDPAGGPLTYYYPAAGRVLMFGVESNW